MRVLSWVRACAMMGVVGVDGEPGALGWWVAHAAAVGCVGALLSLGFSTRLAAWVRARARPGLERVVERGHAHVRLAQRFRSPVLDYFHAAAAALVSIEFYVTFLPLAIWSGHRRLGLQLVILLSASLFAGNALKDVFCAPRPAKALRVVKDPLTQHFAEEYGLPSTHAINSTVFAVHLIRYARRWADQEGPGGAEWARVPTLILAALCVEICFGRLYLGMHTPVDLACGLAVAGVVLTSFGLATDAGLDHWVLEHVGLGPALALVATATTFGYPTPEMFTPSYGYSTYFVGVACGVLCGARSTASHLWPAFPAADPRTVIVEYPPASLGQLAARCAVGFTVTAACMALASALASALVPRFHGLLRRAGLPFDVVDARGRPFGTGDAPRGPTGDGAWRLTLHAKTPTRLLTYFAVGWAVCDPSFRVMHSLGLLDTTATSAA